MYYAVNTTWSEAAKWSQLEEGLYHELKNDLIAMDARELFVDFIKLLQTLDQKRRHLTTSSPGHKAALTIQQHTHTQATHIHAYTPATAATPHAPTGTTTAFGIHVGLIDLSARRKK